jgi:NDP-sugar pyrophosphorylase family protein
MYKAIIHSGGKGTRLRPHTLNLPKALLEVNGSRIIDLSIKPLIDVGIKEFYFTSSYLTELLQDYLTKTYPNLSFTMIIEDKARGRAGAISHALSNNILNEHSKYIILNADDIIDIDIEKLISQHETSKKYATIVLCNSFRNPYGVVNYNKVGVENFTEKPTMTLPFGQGIHAGLGIFKNLTAFKNAEIPSNPENRIYPELVSKKQLGIYIVTDWQSLNTPDEYSRIKKKFASQVEHYPNS